MSKIVAVIPARSGSKGIDNKNIIEVAGKPLIAWTIGTALGSRSIDRVFVSTDGDEIASISKDYGADVINRPADLAGDGSTSEDALLHALKYIEEDMNSSVDALVFLQATSPLRQVYDIDNAVNIFQEKKADSLFSCYAVRDYFMWKKEDGEYKSVNYDYRHRQRRQDINPTYLENGSIYIMKPELLRRDHCRLGGNIEIYVMDSWKSFQIDKPEDIDICEYFLRKKIILKDDE